MKKKPKRYGKDPKGPRVLIDTDGSDSLNIARIVPFCECCEGAAKDPVTVCAKHVRLLR